MMIAELTYIDGIVGINGNQFGFDSVEVMNEIQVILYLTQGNNYLLTADFVTINGVLQTSAQMIADTFNA
jgi:hypothetical protein